MRKVFFVLFVFCSFCVYSQTWTEKTSYGGRFIEWTVITREDFSRLSRQNEEDETSCQIIYTDYFEIRTAREVLTGTRPDFNGYYYLYGKWYGNLGISPVLAFGNSNTGRMDIFYSRSSMYAGSSEYWALRDRYNRRVMGDDYYEY
jgi:hypothetical protein